MYEGRGDRESVSEARDINRRAQKAADWELEKLKKQKIEELSKQGDLMYLEGKVLGWCSAADCNFKGKILFHRILDYKDYTISSGSYEAYDIERHVEYSGTGSYSGSIDSSGNVSIYENVDTYRYKTIKRRDRSASDRFTVKVVEKGKSDRVKELEEKFFRNGGDVYFGIKECVVQSGSYDEMYTERLPGKMWKTQLALAVANLIFVICLFAAFNLVVNTTIYVEGDDASNLLITLPLLALIIFYVIIGQVLKRCKRDVRSYYCIKDSMSSGFLAVIIILVVFSFIECIFSWSMEEYSAVNYLVSLVIELVALVVSIIFLVRSANKNDKNRYARLLSFINDDKKMDAIEDILNEIRSYTVV